MVKGWKKRFMAVSLAVVLGISNAPVNVQAEESSTETSATETTTEATTEATTEVTTETTETTTEEPTTEEETPGQEDPTQPDVDWSFVDTSKALQISDVTMFELDELGYITSYKGEEEIVVVPAIVGEVEVVGLKETFFENTTVEKVYIPDSITVIGDKTFAGASSLSEIAYYKFTEGMFVDGVMETVDTENVPQEAYGDAFANYVVYEGPDGKEFCKIEEAAGCACIPAYINLIGSQVFYGTKIASFRVAEENEQYKSAGDVGANQPENVYGCLLSKDGKVLVCLAPMARYGYEKNETKYILPEGLEEISFYACSVQEAREIVVPNTVTKIHSYAFYNCGNLLSIIFEEESSVEDIGDYAFADNANLDIKLPKSVKSIGVYTFANIANRTPDISESSITVLPAYCFYGCINLHVIVMPETLVEIKSYAFSGNDNVNEVVFKGDTLSTIGSNAFADCVNLHKIEIPEGVTAIEDKTFAGCDNLETIILPDSLESIGNKSFADCQNIKELVIPENVKEIAKDTFEGVQNKENIDTSKNVYAQEAVTGKKLPKVGSTFKVGNLKYKVVKVKNTGVQVVVTGVKKKSITTATVNDTVKYKGYKCKIVEISSKAFYKCTKLKSVKIGKNVKKIGKSAFEGDKKLKTITINSTKVTYVGKNAIKGIDKKAQIKVSKSKVSKYKKLFKSSTGFKKSTMKVKKK